MLTAGIVCLALGLWLRLGDLKLCAAGKRALERATRMISELVDVAIFFIGLGLVLAHINGG